MGSQGRGWARPYSSTWTWSVRLTPTRPQPSNGTRRASPTPSLPTSTTGSDTSSTTTSTSTRYLGPSPLRRISTGSSSVRLQTDSAAPTTPWSSSRQSFPYVLQPVMRSTTAVELSPSSSPLSTSSPSSSL